MLRRASFFAAGHTRRLSLGCLGATCALLLLAAPALASTSGQLLWVRAYRPASGGAVFADVAVNGRGSAHAVGFKRSNRTQTLVLVKYDRDGRRRWVRTFRGDYARTTGERCALDGRGYVYVGGFVTRRNGEGGVLLVRYAPDGTRRWSRVWSPGNGAFLQAMAVDALGNVYLTAESDIGQGRSRISGLVVAKYSTSGERLWAVRYRDPADPTGLGTIPNDLALDAQGGVYVVGACSYHIDHEDDIYTATPLTLKLSAVDGSLLASAVYPASDPYVEARAIDVRDSTVAVCGTNHDQAKTLVINYDLSLSQRYALESQPSAGAFDVAMDLAGATLVAGWDAFAFSPEGTPLWQQVGTGGSWVHADKAGNSYFGGAGGRSWGSNLRVSKYDSGGNRLWTGTWPVAPGRATPYCFTLGKDGVYIGGQLLAHSKAILAKFAL